MVRDIHDGAQYRPHYLPWLAPHFQKRYTTIRAHTLVAADWCWYLSTFAKQALMIDGSFLEAGTYKAGTALLLRGEIEAGGGTPRISTERNPEATLSSAARKAPWVTG
jgi:hypothetical protein